MTSRVDGRTEAVRRFNRFYTTQIGVLRRPFLGSELTLTEVRVLYELANADALTASDLCRDLDLDPGYASRMLRDFSRRGLIRKRTSTVDRRVQHLSLTETGRTIFEPLDARARQEIRQLLGRLHPADQRRLVESMRRVEEILGDGARTRDPYRIRPPEPGDLGWVVQRHGALYAEEY